MTNPQPLSAHQRNAIRLASRQEWIAAHDVSAAVCAAQIIVSGLVLAEQLSTAREMVAQYVAYWCDQGIRYPDVSPMWGEPGQQESPVRVAASDLKHASGGTA